MTEQTDRQLLDRELARYTTMGWRIISQADSGFQVAEPKKLNQVGMALLVMLPALLGCLLFFILPSFGIVVLVLAAIGLAIVLIDYAVKKEKLLYITAADLRMRPGDVGRVIRNADNGFACSLCGAAVTPDTKTCPKCKKPLIVPASIYAGLK